MPRTWSLILGIALAPLCGAQESIEVEQEERPLAAVARVNNRFAIETYRRAARERENLIVSPLSIRAALERPQHHNDGKRWLFVCSWSEWHEGSQIEPSSNLADPEVFLDTLKEELDAEAGS